MLRHVFSGAAALLVISGTLAHAQKLEPIPEGQSTTKLVRLYLVAADSVTVSIVEVNTAAFDKMAIGGGQTLHAFSYRLSADNESCEAYSSIGSATKVSDTQIAVELSSNANAKSKVAVDRLGSFDPLKRHALILLPGDAAPQKAGYAGKSLDTFAAAIQPKIDAGGLLAFPVSLGVQERAVKCKCKAFFGCTTGCCTNPTCKVIVGFCQQNSNCKKVDMTSNCNCAKD